MEILKTYSFQIVLLGTFLLSISSPIIGTINLYKGQSLIGDAIGHSTFFGTVLFFMLFNTRNPLMLLIGASLSGFISYTLIQLSEKSSRVKLDANLAIFLTGFFGLGLVLKSYIQGNSNYQNASQSGLETFIFGQTSYMLKDDVTVLFIIASLVLLFYIAFKKHIMMYIFDKDYSIARNLNINLLEVLISILTIIVVSSGIKSVGAILISSFLILPAVSSRFFTRRLDASLIIAILNASISSFVGSYFSSMYRGLSTGPTIIVVMGVITLLASIFGRYGAIKNYLIRKGAK